MLVFGGVLDLKIRWLDKKKNQTHIQSEWWFNIDDLPMIETKQVTHAKQTGVIIVPTQTMNSFLGQIPQNDHRFASNLIPWNWVPWLMTPDKPKYHFLPSFPSLACCSINTTTETCLGFFRKSWLPNIFFNGLQYPLAKNTHLKGSNFF